MPTPSKKGFAQVFDQSALIQQHREQQQQIAGQEIKYTEEFVDTQQKLRGMIQQAYAESPDGVNELALGAFTGYADKWFQGAVEEAMAGPITQAVPAQLAANLAKAKQAGNGAVKQGMEIIKAAGDEFQTDKLTQFIIGRLNENFERGDIYGALDEMSSMKVMDRTGSSVVLDELQIGKNFVEKMGDFQHGTYSSAAVSSTTASNIYNFQAGIPTDIKRDVATGMVADELMAAAANDAQMSRVMEDEVYHQAFLRVHGAHRTQKEWEDYREMMLEGTRDEKVDAEVARMNESGEAQWYRSEALAQTAMLAADRKYSIRPRESFGGGGVTPPAQQTAPVRPQTFNASLGAGDKMVYDKFIKDRGIDPEGFEATSMSVPGGRKTNLLSSKDGKGGFQNLNTKEVFVDITVYGKPVVKVRGAVLAGLTNQEFSKLEQLKRLIDGGTATPAQVQEAQSLDLKIKEVDSDQFFVAADSEIAAQRILELSPEYDEANIPKDFTVQQFDANGNLIQRKGDKRSAVDRLLWFQESQNAGVRQLQNLQAPTQSPGRTGN